MKKLLLACCCVMSFVAVYAENQKESSEVFLNNVRTFPISRTRQHIINMTETLS